MSIRIVFPAADDAGDLLVKATSTKTVNIPGYTRKDGAFVPAHATTVHYDPDKESKAAAKPEKPKIPAEVSGWVDKVTAGKKPSEADSKLFIKFALKHPELAKQALADKGAPTKIVDVMLGAASGKDADKLAKETQEVADEIDANSKAAKPKPKPKPTVSTKPEVPESFSPGQTFDLSAKALMVLPAGSVIQIEDGRKMLVGKNAAWFQKKSGNGWYKNGLNDSQIGSLCAGGYGKTAVVQSVGAPGWMSDHQKNTIQKIIKDSDGTLVTTGNGAIWVAKDGKPSQTWFWTDEKGDFGAGKSAKQKAELANGEFTEVGHFSNGVIEDAAEETVEAESKPESPKSDLAMPEFKNGAHSTSAKDYYEGMAQKVMDAAAAGDLTALENMKATGMAPNSKGKVSQTWQGKTANSKAFLKLYDAAVAAAGNEITQEKKPIDAEASETDQEVSQPWGRLLTNDSVQAIADKVTEAKPDGKGDLSFSAFNKTFDIRKNGDAYTLNVNGKYLDSFTSVVAAKQAFMNAYLNGTIELKSSDGPHDGDTMQGANGLLVFKNGRWHKQAEEDNEEIAVNMTAADGDSNKTCKVAVIGNSVDITYKQAGKKEKVDKYDFPDSQMAYQFATKKINEKKAEGYKVGSGDSPAAPAPTASQENEAASDASLEKQLNRIPWDKFELPDSNSNAKSVNKKLAAIKEAAYAGDFGALAEMKFGKNTYNKKLAKLADAAAAAIKEVGQPTVAPEEPRQPEPAQDSGTEKASKVPSEFTYKGFFVKLQPFENGGYWIKINGEHSPIMFAGEGPEDAVARINGYLAKGSFLFIYENPDKPEQMKVTATNENGAVVYRFNTKTKKYEHNPHTFKSIAKAMEYARSEANPAPVNLTQGTESKAQPEPEAEEPQSGVSELHEQLNKIPWEKFELPETNVNHKSVNKKLQAIKDAAYAGDGDALEAMKFGKNTYNKKLAKVAALASLAVGTFDKEATPPPSSPAAEPVAPLGGLTGAQKDALDKLSEADMGPTGSTMSVTADGKLFDILKSESADSNVPHYVAFSDEVMFGKYPTPAAAKAAFINSYILNSKEKPGAEISVPIGLGLTDDEKISVMEDVNFAQPDESGDTAFFALDKIVDILKQGGPEGAYSLNIDGKYMASYPSASDAKQAFLDAYMEGSIKLQSQGGPQEGDTMPGAHGMLIFHNGRWHKQEEVKNEPSGEPIPVDDWQSIGGKLGSNDGAKMQAPDGSTWYVKHPENDAVAKNEVLAGQLYKAAGVHVPQTKLVTYKGKLCVASEWKDGVKKASSPDDLAMYDGALSSFTVDAWLANWDVVGLGYDNMLIDNELKALRIDHGGALLYRAQGEEKGDAFGNTVDELKTLLDPKKNSQSAKVFGGISKPTIEAGVSKVLAVSPEQIVDICQKFGPGDSKSRGKLAEKLIARQMDLAKKYSGAKGAKSFLKKYGGKPDPRNLPVEADKLPPMPNFSNWEGSGKGLSSVQAVNDANDLAAQEVQAAALKGDYVALKKLNIDFVNKETGEITKKPVWQHPSQHVKNFYSNIIDYMEVLANPAANEAKRWRAVSAENINELSDAFKPHYYGVSVGQVPANERLGFWISLGETDSAKQLAPKKLKWVNNANIQAGKASTTKMPKILKKWMSAVKASGSNNQPYRDGAAEDYQGSKTRDVLEAAYEHAVEFDEGTKITKFIDFNSKQMIKQMLELPEGHVFQNPGSMCASLKQNWKWSGQAKLEIVYAKGAKALYNIGVGSHDSEGEVTTLPGQRFMLISRDTKSSPPVYQLLMLPPDADYVANIKPE